MKTVYLAILSIGLILGIGITIMLGILMVPRQPNINITIEGLKDTYEIGKQFSFHVKVNGYGSFCGSPDVEIFKTTNRSEIVWTNAENEFIGINCPERDLQLGFGYFGISINQTGSYTLSVDNKIEKEFSMVQLTQESWEFGHGILEFNKNLDDDFSCSDVTPKPETKMVERKKDLLLNIDEKPGYFFIILGQLNSTSYQYLQIGLHRGNDSAGPVANPSYFIDLKKQGQPIMGGLYQGDPSLAVVLESDKEETIIHLEDNYKKYLGGTSKDVTYPGNRLGPGEYDFHAILFQSDKPEWIQHDVCAISLDWNFSVNDDGVITTNPPKTEKGKLSDVTKEFPPLQQHKKGVNIGDIECRYGLSLIMKSKDHTPACVKPETKTKLVQRGWAINDYKLSVQDDGPADLPLNDVKIILSGAIDDLDSGVTFHPPYIKTILNSNNTVTWINRNDKPVKLESDEGYFSTEIQSGKSLTVNG